MVRTEASNGLYSDYVNDLYTDSLDKLMAYI